MKASIIIPTYNRGEVLCNTLEMALQQDFDDYEVIVVDQTPSYPPAIQEQLNSLIGRIRYYKLATPNVSVARNLGIRFAKGEVMVFIDDDVIFSEDWLTSHIHNFIQDTQEKIGGVMGLTLESEDSNLEDPLRIARRMFGASGKINLGDTIEVSWLLSGNVAYRKKVILEAGMFDEYLNGVCDDADLAVRVKKLKYRLLLDTKIKLIHMSLTYGGGEMRNPKLKEQKEDQELVFYIYFLCKNRKAIAPLDFLWSLLMAYRRYTLKLSLITKEPWRMPGRHLRYIKLIKKAVADLAIRRKNKFLPYESLNYYPYL